VRLPAFHARVNSLFLFLAAFLLGIPWTARGQSPPQAATTDATAIYTQLKAATLAPEAIVIENFVLHRDRVTMTFASGTLYLGPPIAGRVRCAVFIGAGTFHAEPPPQEFERQNVRRLLRADDVTSDFKTAVLRFTDDTDELLPRANPAPASAGGPANRLVTELEPRLLEETGLNLSARELESILNGEAPGVFLAQFDGGKRRRFTFLLDPQSRIPVANFGLNAGESGLVFSYDADTFFNDVWMAFYTQEQYAKGIVPYSDTFNLVDTPLATLSLDLLEPKKVLGLKAKLELVSRVDGLYAIPMSIGESLGTYEAARKKKQMRVLGARLADGTPLTCFQEIWEGGFTIISAAPIPKGKVFTVEIDLLGDFMMESLRVPGTYFPRSTTDWYPRHGYLARSRFDIIMLHRKRDHVVSVGVLVKDEPSPESKDHFVTEFRMEQPIGFASFAVGPYEIHKDVAKQEDGTDLPIEFYSMPGDVAAIKEDFILAEMSNSIRYFSQLFGKYPYPVFRGAYHPFAFGQGFATTIMIPAADSANSSTFSFIAHETSHQWWGDLVLWRSYRDQWLSEGFADYSGLIYTQLRDKTKSEKHLIELFREYLKMPPQTLTGIGPGRLADVGPLIMGHRLESRETRGAYSALIYKKGALVLRMMHFLFTDPQTGDGTPFFDMMTDFVQRYKNGAASTEEFFAVANEHVKSTPLAKKYGYNTLNWFFHQWVTQTYLPSYELSYHIEDDRVSRGAVVLKGEITQMGVPETEKWFMPLPVLIHFAGGKTARGTVAVLGSHSPISIRLPQQPEKVELDPELWILSDKTSTTNH
jgi:hypothetical protein